MAIDDEYDTIDKSAEGIFRDKGSRFLAYAFPFDTESGLKDILAGLKLAHPKARHFCWAYRLSIDKSVFRVNDDGEPSGSAGRPILNTILSENLTNILVVVIRYFGGTLLGVPGLIHAYKAATLDALSNCTAVSRTVNNLYLITFSYETTNQVMKIIKDAQLAVVNQKFDLHCELEVAVRQSRSAAVVTQFEQIEGVVCKLFSVK